MDEPKVGQYVRIVGNFSSHSYKVGQVYRVVKIDTDDRTFIGADPITNTGDGWVQWAEASPIEFGWEYCQSVVPPEVAMVLSGCRGIEAIALRADVKDAILKSLPDLRDRILEVMAEKA
jgi:hypothetical protein